MILAWRIDKASRSQSEAFSGEGACRYGGRWSHRGIRVVYASQSLSLAALEKFVHAGPEGRDLKLVSYRMEVPAGVRVEKWTQKGLPSDWRHEPAPGSTKEMGTAWAEKNRTAVLMVPSIIVPAESNFLFNPLHPEFKSIKIAPAEPFSFDPRMWDKIKG